MAAGTTTHYDTLGITPTATTETVRAAHTLLRKRALAGSDPAAASERLRVLDTAFIVLSNPTLRRDYDRQLSGGSSVVSAAHVAAASSSASDAAGYRGPAVATSVPRPAEPAYRGPAVATSAPPRSGVAVAVPDDPRAAMPGGRAPSLEARRQAEAYLKRPRDELASEAFAAQDWAGFWRRFFASWIDGLVVYVPQIVVAFLAGFVGGLLGMSEGTILVLVFGAMLGMFVLYHALFLARDGVATPGRMALGIAVVDADNGGPLTTGRAVARTVLSMIGYFLLIPNLLGLFNARKQSMADFGANSVVVRYRPTANALVVIIAALIFAFALIGILAAVAIPAYQDFTTRARVLEVQNDLGNYARAVEERFVERGRVPNSLDDLQYRPRSRIATYSIKPNGAIVAEMQFSARQEGALVMTPELDKATGKITWKCVSDGLRPNVRPKQCPQFEAN